MINQFMIKNQYIYICMTHYVVLVIVPHDIFIKGHIAVKQYINDIMHQYSENIEVNPYIIYTHEEIKNKYESERENGNKDSLKEYIRLMSDNEKNLDENGNIMSTNNPNSLYDWFEIGGRWDGYFTSNNNKNYIKINKYSELIKKGELKFCNHFVDEKGNLHKKRDYGWWGSFTEIIDDKDYIKNIESVLGRNQDNYLYVIDCHI
jgi:hypothetical protein